MQKRSGWWGDHPVRHGRSLFGICSLLVFETTTKIGGNNVDLLDWKKKPDLVVNYINIRNWVYCRGFIVNSFGSTQLSTKAVGGNSRSEECGEGPATGLNIDV